MKLFLNQKVDFKSKDNFSCIYHTGTGWYYPCKPDFWKSLQSYRRGKEIDKAKLNPALSDLVQNRFLIEKKSDSLKDYLDFYPVRVPGTVSYEEGLTVYVAVERSGAQGEIDFQVKTLEGIQAKLWSQSSGAKTIKKLIEEFKASDEEVLLTLKEWTSLSNQMTRLIPISISEIKEMPLQLAYKAPFLPKKGPAKSSADDVHRYHLKTIKEGEEQFEKIESTLSHLYRVLHPILYWKSYGQALLQKINDEKTIESGMKILEIGGGMGSISTDILLDLKKKGRKVNYFIYDLSPALIRSQQEMQKKVGVMAHHIHGNGEIIALKDDSIDIALSNEVIADFHTPEVRTEDVKDTLFDREIPMTREFFNEYKNAPEKVRVNLGAFMLLKELYRVLKPGGLAVITEFGYQDRLPFRAGHLDHAEYSIQFSQMISVAAALGFGIYLTDAWDYLGFRDDVKLMSHFSYQAALRILEQQKIRLPNITYSEELFNKQLGDKAKKFRGITYVEPQKDPFKVVKILVCTKPESPSISPG